MIDRLLNFFRKLSPLFWLTVAAPTFIAVMYFGFIASDVYVSESRFVVRTPDKPSLSGIGLLLKNTSFGNASEEIYTVIDYARSRDALKVLNQGGHFEAMFENPDIDVFDRFGAIGLDRSFEKLYRYYQHKVSVDRDSNSQSIDLTVRAYTAKDAFETNEKLLLQSEALVNRLNARGQQDLIVFAAREVADAEAQDRNAALALSAYRNATGFVDPQKQAEISLQLISKIQDELITTKTQLLELRAFTPQNPQVAVLNERAVGLQREIESQTAKVAGNSGSLAGVAARYQRLALESQFADRQLSSALTSLEDARNEARRKQVYLERIVQPNLPDTAAEPRRLRYIFTTFMLGLVAWGVLTMLLAGLREHQD